jgi:hypothetical protein
LHVSSPLAPAALSVGTNGREILAGLIYIPAISSSRRVPIEFPNR